MKSKPTKKHTHKFDDSDYLMKCARIIEDFFKSRGIDVKVSQVTIDLSHYEFSLKLGDNTHFSEVEKYKSDLAKGLELSVSKIGLKSPASNNGVGIRISKSPKESGTSQSSDRISRLSRRGIRHRLSFAFFWLGQVSHHIGRRILDGGRTRDRT